MAKANPESQKWPADKDRYDENYIKIFGPNKSTLLICKYCKDGCPACNWMGFFWVKEGDKQR